MKLPIALTAIIVLLPMLITGVIFWFAARTRRAVLFGVSVPVAFPESVKGRYVVAQYRTRITFLTLAAMMAALPPFLRSYPWLPVAGVPCVVGGGLLFWQLARRSVLAHAVSAPVERQTSLQSTPATAGWLAGLAAALVPLAGTWLYTRAHLLQLPARFATHWDFNGVPNGWTDRSAPEVYFPLVLGAAVILLMLAVAIFMRWAPTADRQRALHVMLPTLTALGWSFSAVFCALMLVPFRSSLSPVVLPLVVVGHLVFVLIIIVWMLARLMRTQGAQAYDSTPDAGWRAGGLVYYNPADAAVMVPQRLGWGWTLNFGRPAAWVYTGVVFAFAITAAVLPFLLSHHRLR